MVLIDTHAHLYLEDFDDDIDQVVERCLEHEVKKILLPNIDQTTIGRLHQLAARNKAMFYPMMGLHPCSVKENYEEELAVVKSELDKGQYIAVGEIGLDFYWDTTFKEQQIEALARQVNWAKEKHLPVALHCRDSFDTVVETLKPLQDGTLRGVFHCFTGNTDDAKKAIDLGFYLGIGGVVTFKNSGLDKTVADLPLERILLETDAPYLTPAPFRGKRNESSHVHLVAKKLSEIFNLPLHDIATITSNNARALFAL